MNFAAFDSTGHYLQAGKVLSQRGNLIEVWSKLNSWLLRLATFMVSPPYFSLPFELSSYSLPILHAIFSHLSLSACQHIKPYIFLLAVLPHPGVCYPLSFITLTNITQTRPSLPPSPHYSIEAFYIYNKFTCWLAAYRTGWNHVSKSFQEPLYIVITGLQ